MHVPNARHGMVRHLVISEDHGHFTRISFLDSSRLHRPFYFSTTSLILNINDARGIHCRRVSECS